MRCSGGSLPGGCFFIGAKAAPTLSTCIFGLSLTLIGQEIVTKKQNHHPFGKTEADFPQTQVYNMIQRSRQILSTENRNGLLSAAIPI